MDFEFNGKRKPQGNIQSSCYPDEWLTTSFREWANNLKQASARTRTKDYINMMERDKGYWVQF